MHFWHAHNKEPFMIWNILRRKRLHLYDIDGYNMPPVQ